MKLLLLTVGIATLAGHAVAANRCFDAQGKVTYQDAPCSSTAEGAAKVDISESLSSRPSVPSPGRTQSNPAPGVSNDYKTFRGAWRGPSQFELSLNGVRDGDAHAIVPMVIEIRPDGEVVGQASTSGCKLSGLATQNIAPYIAALDVSLKGCTDARFNIRYSGNLGAVDSAKEAKLHLVGLVMTPASPVA